MGIFGKSRETPAQSRALNHEAVQIALRSFLSEQATDNFNIPPRFAEEVYSSGSLVAVTVRPVGIQGVITIYGGTVTTSNKESYLVGDRINRRWHLPYIGGYCVRFTQEEPAYVNLGTAESLNIVDSELLTLERIHATTFSLAGTDEARHTMSRLGLQAMRFEDGLVDQSIRYIDEWLFAPGDKQATA